MSAVWLIIDDYLFERLLSLHLKALWADRLSVNPQSSGWISRSK